VINDEFGTVAQARQIFDESFLSIRAKLIEVAAMLDRIDRATESVDSAAANADVSDDPRRARVEEAIDSLLRGNAAPGERAATLQRLFSRPYDPQWRDQFEI
jgi:hypothetical protein